MSKITVIVPAYNAEAYIKKCIDSIMCQTFNDIQLVIINDGSTDNTDAICQSCCNADKRIIYIKTENKGAAIARNIGIEHSNAKWLCFVDSDDYLPQNALEMLYSNTDGADIVIGDYYTDDGFHIHHEKFFSENVSAADRQKDVWLIGNALGCPFYGARYSANVGVPWAKLYSRDFIENVQGRGIFFPPTARMQDTIFNINLFLLNPKLVYIDQCVYYYRIVGNSAVRRYRPDFDTVADSVLKYLQKPVKENDNDEIKELYTFKQLSLLLETIRLSYVHPQCGLKAKEKIEGIKLLCEDKSVDTVFKNCDKKLLSHTQKCLLLLLTKKHYGLVYYSYYFKTLLKKLLMGY